MPQSKLVENEFPTKITAPSTLEVMAGEVQTPENLDYPVAVFTDVNGKEYSTSAKQVVAFVNGRFPLHLEAQNGEALSLWFYEEAAINPKTQKPTGRNALKVSVVPRK